MTGPAFPPGGIPGGTMFALWEYAKFFGRILWPPNWIRLALDLRAERRWQERRDEIMPRVSAGLVAQMDALSAELREKRRARLRQEIAALAPDDPQRADLEQALAALDEPTNT